MFAVLLERLDGRVERRVGFLSEVLRNPAGDLARTESAPLTAAALHAVAEALTAYGFAAHTERRGNELRIVDNFNLGPSLVRGFAKGGVIIDMSSSAPVGTRVSRRATCRSSPASTCTRWSATRST